MIVMLVWFTLDDARREMAVDKCRNDPNGNDSKDEQSNHHKRRRGRCVFRFLEVFRGFGKHAVKGGKHLAPQLVPVVSTYPPL